MLAGAAAASFPLAGLLLSNGSVLRPVQTLLQGVSPVDCLALEFAVVVDSSGGRCCAGGAGGGLHDQRAPVAAASSTVAPRHMTGVRSKDASAGCDRVLVVAGRRKPSGVAAAVLTTRWGCVSLLLRLGLALGPGEGQLAGLAAAKSWFGMLR